MKAKTHMVGQILTTDFKTKHFSHFRTMFTHQLSHMAQQMKYNRQLQESLDITNFLHCQT
jgi:predicted HAD superfamily phosphohydrolase YqeG